MMTLDELKKKCISDGRSLQWMLTVLSEEDIISRILAGSFAESVQIKGGYVLQCLGNVKSSRIPALEFAVSAETKENLPVELKEERNGFIHIMEVTAAGDRSGNNDILYLVKAVAFGIPTAFYMKVHFRTEEESRFYGRVLPRLSGEGDPFPIRCMYPEGILGERFFVAMTEKETVDSMETWYDMFYISTAMMLDGHRLWEVFEQRPAGGELKELNKSKSLCNRWRAFARENKVPMREFPDLTEHLSSVIMPVTDAREENTEFFGTWMPELCRYID